MIRCPGGEAALLPPLKVLGSIPREAGCSPAQIYADFGPFLGTGVRVVKPGESVLVTLAVPADRRPANTALCLPYFGLCVYFINGGGGFFGHYPYAEWAEIPAEAVMKLR